MLEQLQQNPDEVLTFDNEPETKQLVFELGLTGRFNHNPQFAVEKTQQLVSFGEHPTHFIHVILYLGEPDPTENGFVVLCFPRSKVSYPQFMELAKKLLNPTDERIAEVKFFDVQSPDN